MSATVTPRVSADLLAILACPACGGELAQTDPAGEAAPGLRCAGCAASYGFANGFPLLYKDDFAWAPKQRESEGWVELWKSIGIYDDHPVDLEVPLNQTEGLWGDVARMFRASLFQMGLRGGERVLDLGAGEGWAAYHFARRGTRAVAIDIVPDEKLGLGRARKRARLGAVHVDLLVGDNENLPFQPGSFDFVFASNALHHHDRLDALFGSIYKALAPGGRLIAVGDPLVPIYGRESDATDGDREKSFGIIERRRHLHEYLLAAWRAGFRDLRVDDDKTVMLSDAELYHWMDRLRPELNRHALLGSTRVTAGLTWAMQRLPRPFATAALLALRPGSNLMLSGRKRPRGPRG